MQIRLVITIFTSIILLFSACKNRGEAPLFKELSAEQTGINFKNQLVYADSLTVLEFEYMFNGGGVSLCDVNNDGLQDIFFTGNMTSCKLYLNKGNLKFEDITEKAGLHTEGWSYGASIVDINQDGFQDIYISKAGSRKTPPDEMKNQFFINTGNNTFTDKAAEMGLDENGYDIQAAFLDYDKDGDLDMYLTKNAFVNYNRNNVRAKLTEGQAASTDKLFKNEGLNTQNPKLKTQNASNTEGGKNLPKFKDVSNEAGITIEGFGLGVNVCDLNSDNYPDIYVSNDFLTNDLVWINNKNGTFTNKAHDMLRHTTYNGMGNDVADYNNDGLPDIAVVDMLPPDIKRWKLTMGGNTYDEFQNSTNTFGYEPQYVRNTLQLNNGDGTFSEVGQLAGIHATEWSWSPLFADYDNDGKKDLFIANGYRQDVTNLDFIMYGKRTLFMGTPEANRKDRLDMLKKFEGIHIHNYLYCNKGDLTFEDVSEKWGMTKPSYSNGTVYGDLDNDGDLDLVINNLDEISQIYENQTNVLKPDNKWLRLKLKGEIGNRDGLGAQVWLWQNGQVQYQYFSPYRGYLSTMEHFLHFGLQNAPVDSLKILWANGKTQTITTPSVNQVLTLDINNTTTKNQLNIANLPQNTSNLQFTDITQASGINYKHQEDEFVDFKIQPLLPRLYSHDGPCLAVADINGDGLEDFYVGAAAGFKGSFYTQNKNGTFNAQPMLEANTSDDMSVLFFDADKDGDMDLYIASGGVLPQKQGDAVYQHRLFINDGKANFTKNSQAVPPSVCTSASIVTACDYDKDGDLDLFVGGRISAGEYPMPPRSFLLKNNNGIFTDDTPENLKNIGMVTSAVWTDIDGDKWQDLVLVGEFMPITYLKNNNGNLIHNSSFIIHHSAGWWNSITAADFDKDGDMDFIVGNLGLNTPYRPTPKEPVCIYAKDYDKNGRIDPIMCRYENGKEYMTHARDDINKQITPMRARFRDYTSYALATFEKAFRPDEISDAYVVKCEKIESIYLENKGNGQFEMHNLPIEAQFSCINSMITGDYDNDGNMDILAVGNSYSTEVQTGRYDAQGSLILRGDGKGNFKADRHALNVIGDNRAVASLKKADGNQMILIAANSDNLKVFSYKK